MSNAVKTFHHEGPGAAWPLPKLDFSRKGAKAPRKTESFGAFGISCVMLNENELSASLFLQFLSIRK
jgi:hypothetical protein